MGTKQETDGLSATEDTANSEFDALAKALYEGNQEEVDRLMRAEDSTEKGEEAKKEEEAVPETTEKETPAKGETAPSEEGEKTEAATSAASTEKEPEKEPEDELTVLRKQVHQYKSDAGRVPFLQRRLSELERELRATKARGSTPTQKADTTTKPAITDVELDPDVQKDIDELREIDPVLARTMERIAKTAVATANAKVEHAVSTFTESEQEAEDFRFFTEQKQKLLETIPQAEQIFATPEWAKWKETLTPNRRALAESGYADEVIQAIYAFAADMRAFEQPAAPAKQVQAQPTAPEKTEVTEARARKVATSAEVVNPSAKNVEPFDAEQAFRETYTKLAKANHIM